VRFSTFSIRAAHAAQVIPVSLRSMVCGVMEEHPCAAASSGRAGPF
jgi:hypothetical protein